jgi:zinc protease
MNKISLFISTIILSTMLHAQFQEVPNDILKAKIYTLKNGLKVYMTVNKTEPKIQTLIAVKAGSKFDPADNTGLAHYLEHLMFKGTPHLGTLNWEEEKVILAKISDLYEKHKAEKDSAKKREIYREIDKMSYEASKLAVPNEYDKIVTSLGAQGTNAYTSNDQTVYINNIPTNELEKWMKLESERFQHLVMRLFHTELEAVYEEYNISQDNDGRWAYANLMKALFSNHPYGTQTTIGEGEHLKNPSMVNIRNYFEKYYNPNNIAICLSGDLDPEKTVALIEKYFGAWKSKDIKPFEMPILPEITKPISIENFGPQEEFVYIGYRIPASNNKESLKATVIDMIMANGVAGIIDLNVVQKQKTLSASSSVSTMHDGGIYILNGKPKQGQTLEEVRDILLEQVEKFKKGEFDEYLINASINDLELKTIKGYENNNNRAGAFVAAFTEDIPWEQYASQIATMRTFSKQDLIDFASKYYRTDNYAVSYKRKGKEAKPKVDKPQITPVFLNRDKNSVFYNDLATMKSPALEPSFVDYKTSIQTKKLASDVEFSSVKNTENNFAKYCVILPFGKDNSKIIGIASRYIEFLGTEKLTNEAFKKELYKNGLEISTNIQRDKTIITLSGLEQNFKTGIKLLYDNLNTCTVDDAAWKNLLENIIKERENAKINKGACFQALVNYAKYGEKNPFNMTFTNEELKAISPLQVVEYIHNWTQYHHSLFFYGQNSATIEAAMPDVYKIKDNYIPAPRKLADFKIQDNNYDKVFMYNYPTMVQAQIMMTHKSDNFDKKTLPFLNLFNDFFGSGLSSIVFQELREQKALAYSAYSYYATPSIQGEPFFLQAFIGTQADKMSTAAHEFKKLLNTPPQVEIQFNNARESALKQISSDRVVRDNIYWSFLNYKKLGIDYDVRKDVFETIKGSTLASFSADFKNKISNKTFTTLIMGDKSKLKLDDVKDFGHLEEVDIKTLFGY